MKQLAIMFCIFLLSTMVVKSQSLREDMIWARNVPIGTMVLDGNFNEVAWSKAESLKVTYGVPGPMPSSGYAPEFQVQSITDSTHATVKFLVEGDYLWLAFWIPDSSVGGNSEWARWDAILMSVKDKTTARPALAGEYFYTWWLAGLPNTTPVVGAPPRFVGKFGNFNDTTRTPEQVEAWDARTVVLGTSNDGLRDQGWRVEMKVKLSVVGYDVSLPEGEVVALNFSIWDCDYLFEGDVTKISTTRTHWQAPWGNANLFNVGRVMIRPDVDINTVNLPFTEPDVRIYSGSGLPDPIIDGILNDEVWSKAYSFNIAWGDTLVRNSYPGVGKFMSGEFQPELNGNPRPPVLDPSFGNIKFIHKDNFLYVAASINDQVIQGTEVFDKCDGIGIHILQKNAFNGDSFNEVRLLRLSFNQAGVIAPYDYLTSMVDSGYAQFGSSLKGSSTVNNNNDIDEGFNLELKFDLTKLGYPNGLGDGTVFLGAILYDGDSFDDTLANYGTRTWWFREHAGGPTLAWTYLDPTPATSVEEENGTIPQSIVIYGNYPNPFNPSTVIKYSIPAAGEVSIKVFNLLGEVVQSAILPSLAGINHYNFDAGNLTSGIYLYQIRFKNSLTNELVISNTGKMLLLK